MTVTQRERQPLEIDPRTVTVGFVRTCWSGSRLSPLARGRHGDWYVYNGDASVIFNQRGEEVGYADDIFGLPDNFAARIKDVYNKQYPTEEAKREVVLGVAARVVRQTDQVYIEYNPRDLGLWQRVGGQDGLEVAYIMGPDGSPMRRPVLKERIK